MVSLDITIRTKLRIEHNKPDLLVHDLMKNEILLVEVGITNKRTLATVELTKTRKYELLAEELALMYPGARVTTIPVVASWDGLVTHHFKKYMSILGVHKKVQAYILANILKRTCESIMIDFRKSNLGGEVMSEEMQSWFDQIEQE